MESYIVKIMQANPHLQHGRRTTSNYRLQCISMLWLVNYCGSYLKHRCQWVIKCTSGAICSSTSNWSIHFILGQVKIRLESILLWNSARAGYRSQDACESVLHSCSDLVPLKLIQFPHSQCQQCLLQRTAEPSLTPVLWPSQLSRESVRSQSSRPERLVFTEIRKTPYRRWTSKWEGIGTVLVLGIVACPDVHAPPAKGGR